MKLLPNDSIVAPQAIVAARVVPAESVGGDFYNLFKLKNGTGVMIGDVSGHGYQAALIMALAMSAAGIHSQSSGDPGETLQAIMNSLRDELLVTEMFISAFYAVVDPAAKELRFANTGHPHAFLLAHGKDFERLEASDPPIGMTDHAPITARRAWSPRQDLLVLFTDGVSDARNRSGERLGEERILDTIRLHRDAEPDEILRQVMSVVETHTKGSPRRDDLTVVLARS
jgi:phosphoserine phosphatase RsbU/P